MPFLASNHYVEKSAQPQGVEKQPGQAPDAAPAPAPAADATSDPGAVEPDAKPKGLFPGNSTASTLGTLGLLGAGGTLLGSLGKKKKPTGWDYLRNALMTAGLGYGGWKAYRYFNPIEKEQATDIA